MDGLTANQPLRKFFFSCCSLQPAIPQNMTAKYLSPGRPVLSSPCCRLLIFPADLLCDVVTIYFTFSRLVKLCQNLVGVNLCDFVNVALEKVCFPNVKSAKMFDCSLFNIIMLIYIFISSPCCEDQRPVFFRGEASRFSCS